VPPNSKCKMTFVTSRSSASCDMLLQLDRPMQHRLAVEEAERKEKENRSAFRLDSLSLSLCLQPPTAASTRASRGPGQGALQVGAAELSLVCTQCVHI
jgi:hypothetical protein